MSGRGRLSILLYQETPGVWVGRGVEHDLSVEGRTIGETVRAILRFVDAHSRFDVRHDRPPLSAFRAAPQPFWNAFAGGTPVPLDQLGMDAPQHWDISVAIVTCRPSPTPDEPSQRRKLEAPNIPTSLPT